MLGCCQCLRGSWRRGRSGSRRLSQEQRESLSTPGCLLLTSGPTLTARSLGWWSTRPRLNGPNQGRLRGELRAQRAPHQAAEPAQRPARGRNRGRAPGSVGPFRSGIPRSCAGRTEAAARGGRRRRGNRRLGARHGGGAPSFCARLYGRRSAKRRAQAALAATETGAAA